MKKITNTVILILLLFQVCIAGEKKRFFEMTNVEIDSLLTVTANKQMTITERMNYFSEFFLETDYSWTCTGDGPYALLEADPLVNFKETNCMVFCEHVLALAISDSWDIFFNNLQKIRYKDGIIGMRSRNHFTMADWLPENGWLLEDVSRKVGGSATKKMTRTISHKSFFKGKGIKDLRYIIKDRKLTINYIPSKVLKKIKNNLQAGDIGAILFANKTDIFSAHMFMVVDKNGQTTIREASTSKMTTFDTNYEKWAEKIEKSGRYIGIALMRVKDKINEAGEIILPWKIREMKK